MSRGQHSPTGAVNFGARTVSVRIGSAVGLRIRLRSVVLAGVLAALTLCLGIYALGLGDFPLSPGEVIDALSGKGSEFSQQIVRDWRLPVALAAVIFGALLGLGGAIFQSLTRNPLGSPDIIGFDAGSYTAVVMTILVFGKGSYWTIATAALVGGLLTAFLVYALAWRRGMQGFRLIVVGIGVAAILGSVNAYLITRADINDGLTVGFWAAGSLSRVGWHSMGPSLPIALVLIIGIALLAPALQQLELGDDAAHAQGVPVGRSRLLLLIFGVSTTALVTAAAGPIGFVALIAPQLARRLVRSPGVSLISAAVMGAALLTASHVLSLLLSAWFRPVPVGLITVCLGGIYLIWLLIREARRAG